MAIRVKALLGRRATAGHKVARWSDSRLREVSANLGQCKPPLSDLDETLKRLIAEQETLMSPGKTVRPEDITVEYIREQRRRRFYPTTRYDISSKYGGYDDTGLRFLTRQELDDIAEDIESKMERRTPIQCCMELVGELPRSLATES